MGSNSIFAILGLLLIFGLINTALNDRDKLAAEHTYGYLKFTTAHEIARSAINIALKKKSEQSSLSSISGNLDGGSYTVAMPRSNDTVYLNSTALFSGVSYSISTILKVYPKPFPSNLPAVGLHVEDVGFGINNGKNHNPSLTIDGYNHDTTGARLNDTLGVPGVSVMDASDTAAVLTPPFPSQIDGIQNGVPTDVIADPNLPDPANFVDEYISQADYVISATKPVTGNTVYGSANDPKIVYIDGGPDSNNVIQVNGNISGWGVLVIHGSVRFNGTMNWKGLTIAYSDTYISVNASSGNATFLGSVLIGGPPHSSFTTNGSVAFKYSTFTLNNAKWIGKLLAYHILDWYE